MKFVSTRRINKNIKGIMQTFLNILTREWSRHCIHGVEEWLEFIVKAMYAIGHFDYTKVLWS